MFNAWSDLVPDATQVGMRYLLVLGVLVEFS
jgi:hypothetical protein